MKYFKAKSDNAPKTVPKRRTMEEGALKSDEEPQCSAPTSHRLPDKARDPYRRRTGWKRTKKPAAAELPEGGASAPAGAGDVTVAEKDQCGPVEKSIALEGEQCYVEGASSKTYLHHKEQQTSGTCLGLDEAPLEEYSVQFQDDEEDSCERRSELGEAASALDTEVSARLTGLAGLVGIVGTPSEAASSAPSEDAQGIRNWQRVFLPRLTRARQRRDIRLSRKEVLSLQLLMEAVLKQHMNLIREIESVKANMQWESREPVSLSRALSRLQTERQVEAASFARTLATKNKELQRRDLERQDLRQQVSQLLAACRDKDDDLEKAATAMATLQAMHKRTVQELRVEDEERLEDALDKAQQAKELELQSTCVRYDAEMRALQQSLADRQEAFDKLSASMAEQQARVQEEAASFKASLDKKHGELLDLTDKRAQLEATFQDEIMKLHETLQGRDRVIGELRSSLAKVQSDNELESLSLSRALTERESHITSLLAKMDEISANHSAVERALREEVRERERTLVALRESRERAEKEAAGARNELTAMREHQEDVLAMLTKVLDSRDEEVTRQRDAMTAQRENYVRQQESLRNTISLLESQKDVQGLAYQKSINDKEIHISGLLIDIQNLRTALGEKDGALLQVQEELDRKQVEYDTLQESYEDLRRRQHQSSVLIRSLKQEISHKCAEEERLKKEVKERDAKADELLMAMHEKDLTIRETRDQFGNFRYDTEKELEAVKLQLKEKNEEAKQAQIKLEGVKSNVESAFSAQLVELRTQVTELEDSRGRIGGELLNKEEEVKVLKNSVSQMKVAYKELTSSMRCELEKKTGEVTELTKTVKSLQTALDQLRNDHRGCAESGQRREAELERALKSAEKVRKQNEEAVHKLKQSLLEREGKLTELTIERSKLKAEADSLRGDMNHYSKQKENYLSVIDKKDKEIAALHVRYDALRAKMESDCEAHRRVAEDRAAALQAAENSRRALSDKFVLMLKFVRRLSIKRSAEYSALESDLISVKDETNGLRAVIQDLEAEKSKLQKKVLGQESDLRQVQQNLHQYEAHLKDTKDEMDSTIGVWRMKAQEQEKETARLRAALRRHTAELERLRAAEEEKRQLEAERQALLVQVEELQVSRDSLKADMCKKVSELQLDVDVGRKLVKKCVEEHRAKTEKLQQAVENARRERDSELTVLKEAVTRLEGENMEHMRFIQTMKEQGATEGCLLRMEISQRQAEVERLTEVAQKAEKENEVLRTKQVELRQEIEYLEGDREHRKRREEEEAEKAVAEWKSELTGKDASIAALEGTIESLTSKQEVELSQVKEQLKKSESEKQRLQAQLEDKISLMVKELADKDGEVKMLSEAQEAMRAKYEAVKSDLIFENSQLLEMLSRMQTDRKKQQVAVEENVEQKNRELQALIQTMNGALREKDNALQKMRDSAEEAENVTRQLHHLEQDFAEQTAKQVERESTITKKDAELKVLNLTAEALKAELMALKEKIRQHTQEREPMEKQLKEKDTEAGKLAQTVEALKTDLAIQKNLLLTFHEERTFRVAPLEHDALSKSPPAFRDRTLLPQDGDHSPVLPPHRKHAFPIAELRKGNTLRRTASEGDHLDESPFDFDQLISDLQTPSELTLPDIQSDLSLTSHYPTQSTAYST